jgi:site-specific DNA-methyltransferase (adenine-specific)
MATWQVIHGDCLEVLRTLPAGSVDAVVTDPPYSSGGQFRGDRTASTASKYLGSYNSTTAGELPEVVGDTRDGRSWAWWATMWLTACHAVARPESLCCVFTDWRQLPYLTDAVQAGGWVWRGIGVWDKEHARPMSGRFSHQAEYFVWGTSGAIGWDYSRPSVGGVLRHRTPSPKDRQHQTEKPVELIKEMLSLVPEGCTVLDPFCGSGTTGVACMQTGRNFIGIEIDAGYCEIARRRIAEAANHLYAEASA